MDSWVLLQIKTLIHLILTKYFANGSRCTGLGYFEAQSRPSLRLITYFHLLTEVVLG